MLYKYFGVFANVRMQSCMDLWTSEVKKAFEGSWSVKVNVNEADSEFCAQVSHPRAIVKPLNSSQSG